MREAPPQRRQSDLWMQMPGDHMQLRIGHRLMPKQEGWQPYLVVYLHLQLGTRQLPVMISAQDMHVQCGIAFAPCQPLLVPRSAMRRAMQDVAQDPQLAAGMPVQQALQALQVLAGTAAGSAMPARRNTSALPRCRSASSSACRAGQYSARAPSRTSDSPARSSGSSSAMPTLQLLGRALHPGTPVFVAELPAQAFGPQRETQRRE